MKGEREVADEEDSRQGKNAGNRHDAHRGHQQAPAPRAPRSRDDRGATGDERQCHVLIEGYRSGKKKARDVRWTSLADAARPTRLLNRSAARRGGRVAHAAERRGALPDRARGVRPEVTRARRARYGVGPGMIAGRECRRTVAGRARGGRARQPHVLAALGGPGPLAAAPAHALRTAKRTAAENSPPSRTTAL